MRKVKVKMDIHNAFVVCDEEHVGYPKYTNPSVTLTLRPLFTALSTKRPTWEFHAHDQYGASTGMYKRFSIMDGDEMLGTVWVETHWRTAESKIAFDCLRLRKKRERGQHTETKDVKKATKLILENMYGQTPAEFMGAARVEGVHSLTRNLEGNRYRYDASLRALGNVLERLVLDHPGFVKDFDPASADKVDTLLTQRSDKAMADKLSAKVDNKGFTIIVERSGKFFTERQDEEGKFTVYTVEELPDRFKQAVGILKLAEKDTLVPDLGYRAESGAYMVFDE